MRVFYLLLITLTLNISVISQPTISPCAAINPIHVVILGSSTAAGTGPSTSDSAWVNRYRAYLQEINHC